MAAAWAWAAVAARVAAASGRGWRAARIGGAAWATAAAAAARNRSAASNPLASTDGPAVSTATATHHVFGRLLRAGTPAPPVFAIRGEQMRLIVEPDDYFQTLLRGIGHAQSRIVLMSLYLGTGDHEARLVEALDRALATRPALRVHVVLDCLRAMRGHAQGKSSVAFLAPLLQRYSPDRLRLSLYHTPDLNGLLKRLVPDRYNEVVGLQHVKAYLFDDDLMLTGANLSDLYFTNRQDRYALFSDVQHLAAYFGRLADVVGDVSYRWQDGQLVRPAVGADPVSQSRRFKGAARGSLALRRRRIMQFLDSEHAAATELAQEPDADTWVAPLLQLGPVNVRQDEGVTTALLRADDAVAAVHVSSGYFNMTKAYERCMLASQAAFSILTAAPEANGFFGSKGISYYIPAAYTCIETNFLRHVERKRATDRVHVHEYTRPSWTFHAKGMWIRLHGHTAPSLTLLGSPNYGHRSVERDLEAQVLIATANADLQERLRQEQERLYSFAAPVTRAGIEGGGRTTLLWVRVVTALIRHGF